MPNPKCRRSHARQGNHRAHDVLPLQRATEQYNTQRQDREGTPILPGFSYCPRCGQPKLPHRVCGNCGHYIMNKKNKQPEEVIQL